MVPALQNQIVIMALSLFCLNMVPIGAYADGPKSHFIKCLHSLSNALNRLSYDDQGLANHAEGLPSDFPPIEDAIPDESLPRRITPLRVWIQLPQAIQDEIRTGRRKPPHVISDSSVHEFVAVRADPMSTGYLWRFRVRDGMIEVRGYGETETKMIPIAKSDEAGFQGINILRELIRRNPQWFRELGYSTQPDGTVEIPDIIVLDHRIRMMRRTNPQEAPCVEHFYSGIDGEVGHVEYIRNWARGRAVVGLRTREFFHDLQVHGFGFLVLPPEAVQVARVKARLLMALFDRFQNFPTFQQKLDVLIAELASCIDNATGDIQYPFLGPERFAGKSFGPRPIAETLRNLAGKESLYNRDGDSFVGRIRTAMKELPFWERWQAEKILSDYRIRPISARDAERMARNLENRFQRR